MPDPEICAALDTAVATEIILSGGSGLRLEPGRDAVKAVLPLDTCEASPAGGSVEASQLARTVDVVHARHPSTQTALGVETPLSDGSYATGTLESNGRYFHFDSVSAMATMLGDTLFGGKTFTMFQYRGGVLLWYGSVIVWSSPAAGRRSTGAASGQWATGDLISFQSLQGQTQASALLTFSIAGDYKLCYKPEGSAWTVSSSKAVVVRGVTPTQYTHDGAVTTQTTESFLFASGSGMSQVKDLGDKVKIVTVSQSCATDAPAGGTTEVTDLGPSAAVGATNATASFYFTESGEYKVCYKISGRDYAQATSCQPLFCRSQALLPIFNIPPSGWAITHSTRHCTKHV